ncbi:3',5'-nucleoside bisphosphate phosphatase [Lacisediminimonas sp.]|uniref:3',5'-nucleoside bisphosphate phosphatase n=1 Tax=Lacisediminimonas sp. TaxID=3060582 RepID=UPI00271D3B38|nr:3',5'-nucleoside bisphosphate phosphatase [Lacisediminimonas sp.]MDO8299103.1 3',5'-nucleoside bisphosphate phosphatase [Lacisediminimonas sp.]MDO9217380.1 3',5'-nucleoside bisphosphate phosphatase [Lacisediminimonas sp.]
MLNIDLHCHSDISDGLLSPAALAARAHANGVQVWALTDHDEVGGVAQARAAATALGMRHIAGVEISVTYANQTVHIVGLNIDENNQALQDGLAATRAGRERRARKIGEELAAVGIAGAYEGASQFAGNPDLVSRTHFARFLIQQGHCTDLQQVFTDYLVRGRPGWVPHQWARLDEAVGWIRGAGGVAVVAHPGRYKYEPLAFSALLDEFKAAGGTGIEVITGSHTPQQYEEYALVARRYGLLASRGADFHGPGESRIDLGSLPPLPENLSPVWHDWGL